jgi:hypothetical protein
MKCLMNRRSLVAAALAVFVAAAVLWVNGATAQDAPRAEYNRGVQRAPVLSTNVPTVWWGPQDNSDPRHQADHEHAVLTRKLLSDYSQTQDEKERAKVLEELTKVISEHFDIRQELRERELKDLEEKVKKLRELHQRRAKEKEQITRDHVRQMLRDVDGLGWGDDGRMEMAIPVPINLPQRPGGSGNNGAKAGF